MLKAIGKNAVAYQLAIILLIVAICAGPALAQPAASFADHLLDRLATPMPAAYHLRMGRLFVGNQSAATGVQVSDDSQPSNLERVRSSPDNTILRLRIDPRHERLWILEIGSVRVIDLASRRTLARVDLKNWFYTADVTNCLPDLGIDPTGSAFVTDSVQAKLWRIDADDFSLHEHSLTLDSQSMMDAGFSALVVRPDGSMLAAMAAPGTLWHIERDLLTTQRISLSVPIHGACALESGSGERHSDTVTVLAAAPGRFSVYGIDLSRAAEIVYVEPIAVRGPAGLVGINGVPHLAIARVPTQTSTHGLVDDAAGFVLMRVHMNPRVAPALDDDGILEGDEK